MYATKPPGYASSKTRSCAINESLFEDDDDNEEESFSLNDDDDQPSNKCVCPCAINEVTNDKSSDVNRDVDAPNRIDAMKDRLQLTAHTAHNEELTHKSAAHSSSYLFVYNTPLSVSSVAR